MPGRRSTRLDHAPHKHEHPVIPLVIAESRATRDGHPPSSGQTEQERRALQTAISGRRERPAMAGRVTANPVNEMAGQPGQGSRGQALPSPERIVWATLEGTTGSNGGKEGR